LIRYRANIAKYVTTKKVFVAEKKLSLPFISYFCDEIYSYFLLHEDAT